jgi:hypothetical protein
MKFPSRTPRLTLNKGSRQLPAHSAMNLLTHGSPVQRSLGNFAKLTPSGLPPGLTSDDLQRLGQPPQVVPALPPTPPPDDDSQG